MTSSQQDLSGEPVLPTVPVSGGASRERGDASLVHGTTVDDLDDVEQVTAIPPMPGMSFRGAGADWWEVGATYAEPGWLRSSRDPQVATDNFAGGAAVALFGPGGRDVAAVSGRPEEQETVFLPGSRFTVVRQGDLGGVWVTVVYVHAGDEPVPDATDRISRAASVIARSSTLPPTTLGRPDRFTGAFGTRR